MEDVVKIASYISQRYEHQYGTRIDEISCTSCFISLSVNAWFS